MNEEEKKAIELLEDIKNNSWTTKYIMSSDSKNAELLLNLIEKLQKENEELHKEIDRMKSLDIYKLVEDWETGQFIPIQKIKGKIRKNDEIIEDSNDGDLIHELCKENKVYKELLESEE